MGREAVISKPKMSNNLLLSTKRVEMAADRKWLQIRDGCREETAADKRPLQIRDG